MLTNASPWSILSYRMMKAQQSNPETKTSEPPRVPVIRRFGLTKGVFIILACGGSLPEGREE